jgi:hypothetical protein
VLLADDAKSNATGSSRARIAQKPESHVSRVYLCLLGGAKALEKLSEEELHRRLRRYETLLKSYGASIAELESKGCHDFCNTSDDAAPASELQDSFSVQ